MWVKDRPRARHQLSQGKRWGQPLKVERSSCRSISDFSFQGLTLITPPFVAVGMPVTRHPPHRSRRADFPHRAPASGSDAQSFLPYALLRALQVWGAATGVCRCLFLRFPVLCPSTTVHTFPLTDSVFSTCFAALHSLRPDSLPSTLSADHGAP